MSADLLDRTVLSKPYFDRRGLVVAVRNGDVLGFAHAGFSGDAEGRQSTTQGATCMLMVAPHERDGSLAEELLARSEAYLRDAGATRLLAGASPPADAFYLGLYGGSQQSGILASDQWAGQLFRGHGYQQTDRRLVLQRTLSGFRPLVDRQMMQIRRQYQVEVQPDPPAATWWEACTAGQTERTQFALLGRQGQPVGGVTCWDLEPLASSWGVRAAGVQDLELGQLEPRTEVGLFLLGEAFRQLHAQGVALVEVHVPDDELWLLELYRRLGFQQIDEAVVLSKT